MRWLRFPRVLGIAVCLYLVGMSVIFGYLSSQSYRFVHDAAHVEGTVIGLEVKPAAGSTRQPPARSNPPLAPKVTYVVSGTTYTYVAAHGKYRQRLKIGDTVTVLYDPSSPARARIQGEGKVLVPLITSAFVIAAFLVGLVLFLTRRLGPSETDRQLRRAADRVAAADEPDGDGERVLPTTGARDG